uniref:Protein kinase domain-containing protein n=1 Tax=Syphacia muris TaxID=451379 RepID=A0A158R6B2_9BILA
MNSDNKSATEKTAAQVTTETTQTTVPPPSATVSTAATKESTAAAAAAAVAAAAAAVLGESQNDKDHDSDSDGEGAEEVRINRCLHFIYFYQKRFQILEESPCKRWSKRREQVKQRDVPGIDCAYLAMDNETGNEVVWNEVLFSERKNFRAQEEKINAIFDNLTHLVHINLVKFHKYWTDAKSEKPRIIFITEYMSSGSLARFLQRTRKSGASLSLKDSKVENEGNSFNIRKVDGLLSFYQKFNFHMYSLMSLLIKTLKAWKKWTTQILSALNYLHSCDPPIVHGNLTCNTMFIQHNGLIKIGCVAPNAIHHHVKTFRENFKNMHYVAPEYEHCSAVTPQADIYSFGVCALEMALPEGLGGAASSAANSGAESANIITRDMILKALDTIQDPMQKEFIESCLNIDPTKRPTARELLFHTILFEVHSLKLLAAHCIVSSKLIDKISKDDLQVEDNERVAASTKFREMAYCQVPAFQAELDKFLEDVSNGIYPLTAFAPLAHQPKMTASTSSTGLISDPPLDVDHASDMDARSEATPSPPGESAAQTWTENRSIVKLSVTVNESLLTILIQLDDLMNRQLTTELMEEDTADALAEELVQQGFICKNDQSKLNVALEEAMNKEASDRKESEGKVSVTSETTQT